MENDTETESPVPVDDLKSVMNGSEEDEKLQVKIQAFEEKINVDNGTPGSVRRYSLGQVSKEERKDMRFNRYGSVTCVSAFHEYKFISFAIKLYANVEYLAHLMPLGIVILILTKSRTNEFKGWIKIS